MNNSRGNGKSKVETRGSENDCKRKPKRKLGEISKKK